MTVAHDKENEDSNLNDSIVVAHLLSVSSQANFIWVIFQTKEYMGRNNNVQNFMIEGASYHIREHFQLILFCQ